MSATDRTTAAVTATDGSPLVSPRIVAALAEHPDRSPLLVVDLDVVAERYDLLRRVAPSAVVYYAVKANPAPELLAMLVEMGSSFDVASIGEIRSCLAAGAPAERLSFGNTIKKRADIGAAYALGVRTFAFDCDEELDKLIENAPGSTVFCRVLSDGLGAAWPLSRKFGCTPDRAVDLLRRAHGAGLSIGVSFHVGSQQFDPTAWDRALAGVADLRAELRADGVELVLVNLGGGLPGAYVEDTPPAQRYGAAIEEALDRRLGPEPPARILIEPGRFLVADAGVLRTEVVTVGTKSALDEHRWVYLDVGMFSGLAEVMDEAIRYRIIGADGRPHDDTGDAAELGPVVLAGPTCDSADILYKAADYRLPMSLRSGDRLLLLSVGAYSTTYSTVGFNGFDPLDVEVLAPTRPTTARPTMETPTIEPAVRARAATPSGSTGPVAAPLDAPTPAFTDEQIALLTEGGTHRRYPSGSLLFAEGDPAGPMFVLVSGAISIRTSSGVESITDRTGDVLGELAALGGIPRRASATANMDTEVVAVSPAHLLRVMESDAVLAGQVRALAASRSHAPPWQGSIELNGCPADDLARWVLSHPTFDRSLASVSDDLGVSQELVTRAVDYLVARGALAVDRGRLVVRSTDVLTEVAQRL